MLRRGLVAVFAIVLLAAFPARAGEVTLGMSAAFSGPSRGLGIEFYRGIMACLSEVNATGGVHGNTVRILPLDDRYSPLPTIENTIRFVEQDNVFALFSYVGTPTTGRILPLLSKYSEHYEYLLFPFTGAQFLREGPYARFVYNLRASYYEETSQLVRHLTEVGRKRIAVLYQQDAYGRTGWEGVRRTLREQGLEICSEAAYKRGASVDRDFGREVDIISAGNPDAVICVGTYAASAAFIRDARDRGLGVPIANVSFSDSDNMLKLLRAEGTERGRDYTADLVNSQVVPSYEDRTLPAVREYRQAMEAVGDLLPPAEVLHGETYRPHPYSLVSLEGYLNARVLVLMLQAMGPNPERRRIPEAMRSLKGVELGIGVPLDFSTDNQGLSRVYFTTVEDGRIVPLKDWERWRK